MSWCKKKFNEKGKNMFEKFINYIKEKTSKKKELDLDSLVLCKIYDYDLKKRYSPRLRKEIIKPVPVPRESGKNYIARVLTVAEKEKYINSTYKENKPEYLYYEPNTVYFQLVNKPDVILPTLDTLVLTKMEEGKYSSVDCVKQLKNLAPDITAETDFLALENKLNENQMEQN